MSPARIRNAAESTRQLSHSRGRLGLGEWRGMPRPRSCVQKGGLILFSPFLPFSECGQKKKRPEKESALDGRDAHTHKSTVSRDTEDTENELKNRLPGEGGLCLGNRLCVPAGVGINI